MSNSPIKGRESFLAALELGVSPLVILPGYRIDGRYMGDWDGMHLSQAVLWANEEVPQYVIDRMYSSKAVGLHGSHGADEYGVLRPSVCPACADIVEYLKQTGSLK